jgi:cyclohexanone monooxygenase
MNTDFDVIVIGAGFSGLYALRKLRDELGLRVKVIEKASDVGGTWYWNRYPGALSDSEAFVYCFSDKELFQKWKWTSRFLTQPQILAYLQYVADELNLRKDIQFNTVVASAHFVEEQNHWEICTDGGQRITAPYLVTALGPLSATNMPAIKGQEHFAGELFHTSAWPEHADVVGKRVGVIGTGSTGIQLITAIAAKVKHLTVFQRTPQYSIPVGNGPVTSASVDAVLRTSEQHWKGVFDSFAGMGIDESRVPAMSVSAEERRAIFQKAWDAGGSFRFALETFSDILLDPEANEAAASFIRERIAEIVKDPETTTKLMPHGPYAKRPLCDSGYFQVFNRDNVTLIDLRLTPINEITAKGIRTSDGIEHELDVLIYATGFDALDGNYKRLDIRGRGGKSVSEHWKDGALSYLGLGTSGFPNMFMVQGPNGVFSNAPPAIEIQVNAIVQLLRLTKTAKLATLEVKPEAEREWIATCVQIADATMLGKGKSWFFGDNIPGKPRQVLFYVGGVAAYLQTIQNAAAEGFTAFEQRRHDESVRNAKDLS